MNTQREKHIIIAKVDNKPGVVSRMSGLFTRRGYNIESLVTGVTDDPDVYNMTISVNATEEEVELLLHQLGRVIEVIEVYTETQRKCVTRELMFISIECDAEQRGNVLHIASSLNLTVAGVTPEKVLLEICGDEDRLRTAENAFLGMGKVTFVRSGVLSVAL